MTTILHAGCGDTELPAELKAMGTEIRLDIEPACKPDIVASITDLGAIEAVDMVYSSHCLEHLYPYDVPRALAEFYRVLKTPGVLVLRVPDLEDIKPTEDKVYDSPAGPICGLDMFYGLRSQLEARPYMAHHCGFIQLTLARAIMAAGFERVQVSRDKQGFELHAQAVKS